MVEYEVALIVFAVGLITSLSTAGFIVYNYFKLKDKDPFEGEYEDL